MLVVMTAIGTIVMTDVINVTTDGQTMTIVAHLVMLAQAATIVLQLIDQIALIVHMYNALIVRQAVIRGGMSVILDAPTLVIAQVGDLMMTRVNSL